VAPIIATENSFEKRNEDGQWDRFSAEAEPREDSRPSLTLDYTEEEAETTSQGLRTGRFGIFQQPVDQSTEKETYRDVCTGYIEGTTDLWRPSRLALLTHSRWG
jgi:hypothetical protein